MTKISKLMKTYNKTLLCVFLAILIAGNSFVSLGQNIKPGPVN